MPKTAARASARAAARNSEAFSTFSWSNTLLKRGKGWSKNRQKLADFLSSDVFDCTMVVIIIINIVLMCLETDYLAMHERPPGWVSVISDIVLGIFLLEAGARLFVWRMELQCIHWFDIVVVTTDMGIRIMSEFVDVVPVFSVFRLVRILRFMRALEGMTHVRELYLMLHALLSSLKAVFWALFLITFFLAFWALLAVTFIHPLNMEVAATGEYDDCPYCVQAFDSVWHATLTFIQQIIAGDSWGRVTLPIIYAYPWTAIFFISVLFTVDLALVNSVLSVIVDQAVGARENDVKRVLKEKAAALENARCALMGICKEMDLDRSGQLNLQELMIGSEENYGFSETLDVMDVSKADLATLFEIMDSDDSGSVDYAEFCDQLHRMKNDDTHTMLAIVKHEVHCIRKALGQNFQLLQQLQESMLWEPSSEDRRVGVAGKIPDTKESKSLDTKEGNSGIADDSIAAIAPLTKDSGGKDGLMGSSDTSSFAPRLPPLKDGGGLGEMLCNDQVASKSLGASSEVPKCMDLPERLATHWRSTADVQEVMRNMRKALDAVEEDWRRKLASNQARGDTSGDPPMETKLLRSMFDSLDVRSENMKQDHLPPHGNSNPEVSESVPPSVTIDIPAPAAARATPPCLCNT